MQRLTSFDQPSRSTSFSSNAIQYELKVQTGDADWRSITFSLHDDIGQSVIHKFSHLNSKIRMGIVDKMRSMILNNELTGLVDIVDLI